MLSFFVFSKNFIRKRDLKMVGADNGQSRTGCVVTRSGDSEEETFSAVIAPSRERVSAIPRNVSNAEIYVSL